MSPARNRAGRFTKAIEQAPEVPGVEWSGSLSPGLRYQPAADSGRGSVNGQAGWLATPGLQSGQRRAFTQHLGQALGNSHVQRVMASLPDSVRYASLAGPRAVQRNLNGDPPADPEQLINQLGMMAHEGSFAQWFAGHWRPALGLNPQRSYVGGGGAWNWDAGTAEYTFRPNARNPSIPSNWYQEMQDLYRAGERFGTDAGAIFAWNRNSLQQTIDYWAAAFDARVRSAAGEHAYNFTHNPEYRRFLSIMGLWPPEVTVPSAMAGSPYYRPTPARGAFSRPGG